MEYLQPVIPWEIMPKNLPDNFDTDCAQLWNEIIDEILDEDYFWQSHYKRHTFNQGCRGPLCKKYLRDCSRSRPRSTQMYKQRDFRILDPIIDYFKIVAMMMVTERKYAEQEQAKLAGKK